MPATLTVGLAQFEPAKGNTVENLAQHVELIEYAANEQVKLLIFPELSLTGYEPELAAELAMEYTSAPLQALRKLAKQHSMTILAGAPLRTKSNKPELALVILSPDKPICHYSKIHLHGIENTYFTSGNQHMTLSINSFSIGLAVCADTAHPEHIQDTITAGADCYLASVLCSEQGFSSDSEMLSNYAQQHNIVIGMANYIGQSGPYECAGRSSFWGKDGNILTQATRNNTSLVTTSLTK